MQNPRGQAHIFLPLAVYLGASQLASGRKRQLDGHYPFHSHALETESEAVLDGEFQICMDALRKVQSFNHLAKEHLAVLESQEFVFIGGL